VQSDHLIARGATLKSKSNIIFNYLASCQRSLGVCVIGLCKSKNKFATVGSVLLEAHDKGDRFWWALLYLASLLSKNPTKTHFTAHLYEATAIAPQTSSWRLRRRQKFPQKDRFRLNDPSLNSQRVLIRKQSKAWAYSNDDRADSNPHHSLNGGTLLGVEPCTDEILG